VAEWRAGAAASGSCLNKTLLIQEDGTAAALVESVN
jgi:hypothetical protein